MFRPLVMGFQVHSWKKCNELAENSLHCQWRKRINMQNQSMIFKAMELTLFQKKANSLIGLTVSFLKCFLKIKETTIFGQNSQILSGVLFDISPPNVCKILYFRLI